MITRVSVYTAHGANKKHVQNFACTISNEIADWELWEQMKKILYCALQEQVKESKCTVKQQWYGQMAACYAYCDIFSHQQEMPLLAPQDPRSVLRRNIKRADSPAEERKPQAEVKILSTRHWGWRGAAWFERWRFELVLWRCPVRISIGVPTILPEGFHTCPQAQVNSGFLFSVNASCCVNYIHLLTRPDIYT
jgi:hypothetical protein